MSILLTTLCLLRLLIIYLVYFRPTLRQSRPNKAGLNVRPSVRTYVRAYVCPSTKSFFDFSEIWHIGRGRWVIHDGMQYDPIQGQGQHHEPFKSGRFQMLSPALFTNEAGNWPRILKLWHNIKISSGQISDVWPSFLCHVTLKLAQTSVAKSWPSVPIWG